MKFYYFLITTTLADFNETCNALDEAEFCENECYNNMTQCILVTVTIYMRK